MEERARSHQGPTHLFTLRLWSEAIGDGEFEWRGQVRHVLSGEIHYFREWTGLIQCLRALLASVAPDTGKAVQPEASPVKGGRE